VFWDSGLRNGFDIVKAMGRGAKGCLSGRAWMYGLAANGGKGVAKALDIIHGELHDCMSLSGFTDIRAIPEGTVSAQPAL
jgi:L-lactate dehydrogenase (cytochrome)